MSNLFHRLALWLGWHPARPVWWGGPDVPSQSEPWTHADRASWVVFLESQPGQRLIGRLRMVERLNAITACRRMDNLTTYAARAGGFTECVDYLLSLSAPETITRTPREQGDDTSTAMGVPRLREKLAP